MRIAPFAAVLLAAAAADAQTLLVLNKEGTLAFVDPGAKRVLATVRTGDSPHEVAASADGRFAVVSNYGTAETPGKTLSVIDIASRKELHRFDLGPLRRPHGLFFADGKCYFTAEANKLIGRYDPAANAVDWLLGTGQNTTHMVMVASDGKIFTSNIGSNNISVIEPAGVGNYSETVIDTGKGPEGFDISPDGKQLWTANSRDGTVTAIDLYTKRVLHTFGVQTKRSNRLKFTPDGRLVLITDLDAGDLLILERATRKETKRLKLGSQPAGILITPDSARAYVAVTGNDNVAVIDLHTLDLADRIKTGKGPDGMAWVARPALP